MSGTTAGDLKADIKALVGKFDAIIKEAKDEELPKTLKAAGDVKAMFVKAIVAEPKPETVAFYEAKLAPLNKILQADQATKDGAANVAAKEGKSLEDEFSALAKKAKADGNTDVAKKIEKAKADFSNEMSGNPTHKLVEEYRKTAKALADALDKVEDSEAEEEDDAGDGPCKVNAKKFKLGELDATPDLKTKFEDWLKDAKAKGPRVANKKHGFKATAMNGGVMHFRLNQALRVYYIKDGNELTISGPKHQ